MLTIQAAAAALRAGRLTPVDLLEECLVRVEKYEPRVRAWVLLDRDRARADAERLTAELRRGNDRGPLHGIPIGIKDIFDVFDWPTSCGSKRWAGSVARRDATTVERLRRAGAVFPRKTLTTLFSRFHPPPTRDPGEADRTPRGSSRRAAAGLACGPVLGGPGAPDGRAGPP